MCLAFDFLAWWLWAWMDGHRALDIIPQTVLALRGSDGFSRDLWRVAGVCSRSLGTRSYCKNRYLVTLTFAPLEPKGWSRAQTHKNSVVFVAFVLGRVMTARQPQMLQMSAVETGQMSSVETGQMSAVETGQMSAVETGQMSAVETGQMSAVETRQMSSAESRQM